MKRLQRKGRRNAGDYLEPLTSTRRRKKFCTYDLESKAGDTQVPGFTRPFLVGLYDPNEDEYLEFRDEPHLAPRAWETRHIEPGGCVDKLLVTLLSPRFKGYVFYAHNGGKFDALFLLRWLRDHRDDFDFEVVPIQSTIQLIRVWRRPTDPDEKITETWEFLDSLRLCPMSLAAACETFGIATEESKIEFDLGTHEDDPRWSIYLERDCRSLARVMERLYSLIEDVLGGEVGITAPSTAMKLFLREFIGRDGVPEKIPRHAHWPECPGRKSGACMGCAHDWIRRGYYGGRTEIFRKRGSGLRYYDINSSYVASMRDLMPIGHRIIEEGRLDWRRHRSEDNPGGHYAGFCECEVEVPAECPIPPLPHRERKTGKLIFPTGRFAGVWSLEELRLLDDPLVGGRITKVKRTVWFRLKPMFQRMVDKLWALRAPVCEVCKAAGFDLTQKCPHFDQGLSALAKLLGNSTYGKFAMRQERQTVVFRKDRDDPIFCAPAPVPAPSPSDDAGDTEEEEPKERCILCGYPCGGGLCVECEGSKSATGDDDDDVWYRARKLDAAYIIPHIAAHITATARVRLWQAMREAIATRAGEILIAEVGPGEVVFVEGLGGVPGERAAVVARVDVGRRSVRLRVRGEGAEGASVVDEIEVPLGAIVMRGGRLYYTDTDSIITDVVLPTAPLLGSLKDEYPGETLRYEAVQPKVYVVEKEKMNADVTLRRLIISAGFAGDDAADPSTLDHANARQGDLYKKARPFAIVPQSKVTMKGFPKNMRTKDNLERLKNKETLAWQQLEQVRTLARVEFSRPPKMRDVSKSFRTEYGKRVVLADHPEGFTRAHVLDEPMLDLVAEATE